MFTIKALHLSKRFSHTLFRDISFDVSTGESLALAGPNGSGKSTLLKVVAHIHYPDKGSVDYFDDGFCVPRGQFLQYVGIAAPYIHCYRHLTAVENIAFAVGRFDAHASDILRRFDLHQHKDKQIHYYSTGMVQRLKLALALLKKPRALLLDEPGSNLDDGGKKVMIELLDELRTHTAVIIATNDSREVDLCRRSIELGKKPIP